MATRQGKGILIPNEDLITEKVTNRSFSDNLIRERVVIGISYNSDAHMAIRLAIQVAAGTPRVPAEPKSVCLLSEFANSAVNLELRFWISDPTNGTTMGVARSCCGYGTCSGSTD